MDKYGKKNKLGKYMAGKIRDKQQELKETVKINLITNSDLTEEQQQQ